MYFQCSLIMQLLGGGAAVRIRPGVEMVLVTAQRPDLRGEHILELNTVVRSLEVGLHASTCYLLRNEFIWTYFFTSRCV